MKTTQKKKLRRNGKNFGNNLLNTKLKTQSLGGKNPNSIDWKNQNKPHWNMILTFNSRIPMVKEESPPHEHLVQSQPLD